MVVVALEVVVEAGADRGCELVHPAPTSGSDASTTKALLHQKVEIGDELAMPQRMAVRLSDRDNAH